MVYPTFVSKNLRTPNDPISPCLKQSSCDCQSAKLHSSTRFTKLGEGTNIWHLSVSISWGFQNAGEKYICKNGILCRDVVMLRVPNFFFWSGKWLFFFSDLESDSGMKTQIEKIIHSRSLIGFNDFKSKSTSFRNRLRNLESITSESNSTYF